MIDPKELRIGNYVRSLKNNSNLCFGGNLPFWEVTIDDMLHILNNPKNYESIPLTEDWLVKFGFEENPSHEHPHFDNWRRPEDTDFSLGNYNDEYWVVEFLDQTYGCPEIKYVNQLQNLYFALTGQELTINENI